MKFFIYLYIYRSINEIDSEVLSFILILDLLHNSHLCMGRICAEIKAEI